MKGYAGKLLRVNLSAGTVTDEPLSLPTVHDFIAGLGFGIKYLYDELAPHVDPLGEHNKLLFVPGLLAGTQAQSVSRWLVCTKSPMTGCFARSCCGGDFGAWIRFAGYDFIIVEGKAEKPVYLYVTAEGTQIKDAAELWGKDTGYTQEWLTQQHGKDVRVACIGQAGEKLVKYSAIVSGKRTASRCGGGTIMGTKLLKAVAIKARRNLDLHDPDGFGKLVKEQIEIMRASKEYHKNREYGTTDGAITRNIIGVYPVRNYRYGELKDYQKLSPEAYKEMEIGDFGCYSCSIRCGKIHVVSHGPYAGVRSEGPEYESLWAFTGPIDNTNIESTVAADQLCDDLGLDSISTGVTIGFAYELYEKGIITKDDTDGLELNYGNHVVMMSLIKKIGQREGFGDILAEGTLRAAKHIGKGAEAYAMQTKGLELAGYEPRGLKGTGFGYATSTIGGSHTNGTVMFQEFGFPVPRPVDRFTEEGKTDIVIHNQNRDSSMEVGIVCFFAFLCGDWFGRIFLKMLEAATGIEKFADREYFDKVGERIWNLERAFNVREGFDRTHDTLPQRFQTEPLHTIEAEGEGQILRKLDQFLDEYYHLRGWTQSGVPSREKLQELGLGYVVKDMEPFLTKE
ncbi:putative oxidoreductase YdhV [subsurface metagenome]